jgi:hypothetical protein
MGKILRRSISFRTDNGLEATLYPRGSAATRRLLKACTNRGEGPLIEPQKTTVVKVRVKGEDVYLIYSAASYTNQELIDQLKTNIAYSLITQTNWIIYHNTMHPYPQQSHFTLCKAIIRKMKPGLAALLTPSLTEEDLI